MTREVKGQGDHWGIGVRRLGRLKGRVITGV